MAIDWAQIRTVADLKNIPKNFLFDDDETFTGGSLLDIPDGLSKEDQQAAADWLEVFPEMWGLVLIVGAAGQGKSLFAHALASDAKYLFNKVAVLDKHPRPAFGDYLPFDVDMLKEQLARIKDVADGLGQVVTRGKDKGKWVSPRGEVFLRNSVMMMDEFGSEHMARLDPPNIEPKKSLKQLFPLKRHLHALWLGVGVDLNGFDRGCFPYVDYIVQCSRLDRPPFDASGAILNIGARIQRVRYLRERDKFLPIGIPSFMVLNGGKKRTYLRGLAYKDLFHTDNAVSISLSKRMTLKEED